MALSKSAKYYRDNKEAREKKKEIQSKIYDYAGKMVDYYQSRKDLIKDNMDDTNNMASYRDWETDRKSTRLNSSHRSLSRMPSSA